jgi:1-acyl-sn-glycerol-3-phosphate acyltransferase
LFSNRVQAWLLRSLGVLPVYRRDDTVAASDHNLDTFRACHELFARGGCIGIFPEGVSLEERRVQVLKTGTARIALEAESSHGWSLGLCIVPVGLNFESAQRFRCRVLVNFGTPLRAAAHRSGYEVDPVEAIHQLTATLQESLRLQVVNIERREFEELVTDLEKMYKGELLGRRDLTIPGDTPLQQDQNVSRGIAQALDWFLREKPVIVWRVQEHLTAYRRKLRRLHLQDDQIREHKRRTVPGEMTRFLLLGAIGLPVALYGALWNAIPYGLTRWITRRKARDNTQFHLLQLGIGSIIALLYYAPIIWWVTRAIGPMNALLFAVSLPASGFLAWVYLAFMRRRRRMLQLASLELTHRYAIQRLRQERLRLIAEVDAAFGAYSRRDDPSVD